MLIVLSVAHPHLVRHQAQYQVQHHHQTPTPIGYDYREYAILCEWFTTQIFRLVSGGSFPSVVKIYNLCYYSPSVTGSTSTNDITASYVDCATCEATTPSPTPVQSNASPVQRHAWNTNVLNIYNVGME